MPAYVPAHTLWGREESKGPWSACRFQALITWSLIALIIFHFLRFVLCCTPHPPRRDSTQHSRQLVSCPLLLSLPLPCGALASLCVSISISYISLCVICMPHLSCSTVPPLLPHHVQPFLHLSLFTSALVSFCQLASLSAHRFSRFSRHFTCLQYPLLLGHRHRVAINKIFLAIKLIS